MKKKVALIFGITGQDGSYLCKLLLEKDYKVHGVIRKSSLFNTSRIDDIYNNKSYKKIFFLHYGDITDSLSVDELIKLSKPHEIYNLAAQSHVAVSFKMPLYTSEVTAIGTLKILESIKRQNKKIKFYQASSSEMFGSTKPPQNEKSIFKPQSPYAVAKLFSYWMTINYRNSYGIFACNGILFNHESPQRGNTFVTKKIIKSLCKIKYKLQDKLILGNLYSKRDWGHAKDYVRAMWMMLQNKEPVDYVIATGKSYTIKEFINIVTKKLKLKIIWRGKGLNEKAYLDKKIIIEINKKYFRPSEVENLRGDPALAFKSLKWKPEYTLDSMIEEMISTETKNLDE